LITGQEEEISFFNLQAERKMKIKLYIILFVLFTSSILFGWGEEGHKLINGKAVDRLPAEMKGFERWRNFLVEYSADADKRRKDDPSEFPKHFIDLDFYDEFNRGMMITNKAELTGIYNDSIVTAMGILPWATLETYNNLIKAFADRNRDRIIFYASDLGHYVADGHNPMHTVLNYDGQLSGQKGIHGRYESEMISRYFNEINLGERKVEHIPNPLEYIFGYLTESNSLNPVLFEADKNAFEVTSSRSDDEYYRILWFKTGYVTNIQLNAAVNAAASLIYSAWVEAGSINLNEIN
jgi:hypothetical protein